MVSSRPGDPTRVTPIIDVIHPASPRSARTRRGWHHVTITLRRPWTDRTTIARGDNGRGSARHGRRGNGRRSGKSQGRPVSVRSRSRATSLSGPDGVFSSQFGGLVGASIGRGGDGLGFE